MKKILMGLALVGSSLLAQNHALVIGCCSNYANAGIPLLKGTTNDASHIRTILLERAVTPANLDYLVEKDANYKNITSKVKALESSDLEKGDTLYLYYSGHGTSADDRSDFGKKLSGNADLLQRLNNSTGLIPYDFNISKPNETLIITSRDLRPTFEKLDAKGINIVWIADACYAGNAFRSGATDSAKRLNIHSKELAPSTYTTAPNYKHLLFYGATLTDIMTVETHYKGEYRGAFSVEVVNCLEKNYGKKEISNQDFKNCLENNYAPFAFSSSIYPIGNERASQVVIKVSAKPMQTSTATQNYKEKLFALQNNTASVKLNIYSEDAKDKAIDTFCMRERLNIDLEKRANNVAVFTLDVNNKLIMLYPNSHTKRSHALSKIIQTDVQPPAGIDRVKIFTIQDQSVYDSIYQYKNRQDGVLSEAEAETIYNVLNKSKKFHTALVKVTTINTDIKQCLKGDR